MKPEARHIWKIRRDLIIYPETLAKRNVRLYANLLLILFYFWSLVCGSKFMRNVALDEVDIYGRMSFANLLL